MSHLANRNILLGVTGGIAAYKSADLVRRLQDAGANVRVAMTHGATQFVAPLTFQALSGNPVHTELLDPGAEAGMGHIELAKWADLLLIAPASADFMAQLAHGMGANLLATVCLATTAPIAIAPAMNQAMWSNAATQANKEVLINRGIHQFGPGAGSQACGDIGEGRMLEATELVALCSPLFAKKTLSGKHLVITAGPTREALDPIRYISNNSSGKMGFALAQQARLAGAEVTLIAGPVQLDTPWGCKRIDVTSADDMFEAAILNAKKADIFIATAAVADYKALEIADQKIKKSTNELTLSLTKNPDIVAAVGNSKHRPFTVGFAAETQDVISYAQDKLKKKNLDMIVANDVSRSDIGFNSDKNAVTLISADQQITLDIDSKMNIAQKIIALIASRLAL
ncbi:MAG: bifunctional phosphopantothenoylcysteine decarboxylase/phosphopantothenate--cysteine ligase CoaBC [Pseudomonadales bacterium]|nr:bifunctional phosphopantothenoylcysteine decarboxylase/phosphopantothenate--cysteine ligase CoaBC [Pseudomonadales bacterium]